MKFVHTHLEESLELSVSTVTVLVIENATEFYHIVDDFIGLFEGKENSLSLWKDHTSVKAEKYGDMIENLFHFELNQKKTQTLLYKKLEEIYLSGAEIVTLNKLNGNIFSMLHGIFSELPFTLEHDEITFGGLLKLSSVRFQDEYDTLLEKLICYVNILADLKDLKFLVFVNLKSVLRDEELVSLYHHCENEKIALLLIESSKIRPLLKEEKAIIITEDLCEILESGNEL